MCTRITLTMPSPHQVAEQLGLMIEPEVEKQWRPRYNVAPTQQHVVVRADSPRLLRLASWGLGPHLQLNARAETVLSRKKTVIKGQQQAVIPASGFYEWSGPKQHRLPWYIHRKDGCLLLFAGLVDDEKDGPHFAVITTVPNALIANIHDRMPAILEPQNVQAWLHADNPDQAAALLVPAPPELLLMHRVSTRVNKSANEDPELIDPVSDETEAEQPRQLKLL